MTPVPLLETAKVFFQQQGWRFEPAVDEPILKLGFEGQNGRFLCLFEAKEEVSQVAFYVVRPGPIEPSKRAAVAELFMRINCTLRVGAFELHFDTGMARFRSGVDLENVTDAATVIRNLVLMSVATMDNYAPALSGVLNGQTPIEALPDEGE